MVGYNVRCKLCNCDKRAEAENLHEEGLSLQQIVDFLSKHDITLSKSAVKRHFDTHFAPREEAAKRYYEQSEVVMQQAIEKRLTDLEMLDATIERNYRLHVLATDSIEQSLTREEPIVTMYGKIITNPETGKPMTHKPGPSKPMVELLSSAASEVRQAIKLKSDLLGENEDGAMKVMFVNEPSDDS